VTGCCQIVTAIDSPERANELAGVLVEEHLAACVQVLGPVESVYRWKGEVERAREWVIVAKTTAARRPAAMARIRALHSYDLPEIISHDITGGSEPYLQWIASQTTTAEAR
jgi:periplasmic divalent cation tolerance protein